MNNPYSPVSQSPMRPPAPGDTPTPRARRRRGAAIMVLLVLATVSCIVVGSVLTLSSQDSFQTRRQIDQQRAEVVAEAGLDYGIMKLRDLVKTYRFSTMISQSDLLALMNLIPPPSNRPPYAYNTAGGSNTFVITIDGPIVSGVISNGAYSGTVGVSQQYSITCGARNTNTNVRAVLREHVQGISFCVVRFGVFYNPDLEILPGPAMTFRGPVHANGNLYLGGPLTFYDKLTCAGNLYHRRLNDGTILPEAKAQDTHSNIVSFKLANGTYMDSANPQWTIQAPVMWQGQVRTAAQGVTPLNPPIAPISSPHDIIERALLPTDPNYLPDTEAEKFANKAAVRIFIASNGAVTVTDIFTNNITSYFTNKASLVVTGTNASKKLYYAKDAAGQYAMSTVGCYSVNQTFYDSRQMTNMAPVDLYIDKLMLAYPQLYTGTYDADHGAGIIYVTRDKPPGVGTAACVRIRNGNMILPNMGLTIASDLPVYLEGNYNTSNGVKPCMLAGDAITVLSTVWKDAESTNATRNANSSVVNGVLMTGNMQTFTNAYNGGLENLIRFFEDWTGDTLTFRGSLIDLWRSEIANGPWGGTNPTGKFTYAPPARDWGYDTLYQTANPPGMTKVYGMEELQWERDTWAGAGFGP